MKILHRAFTRLYFAALVLVLGWVILTPAADPATNTTVVAQVEAEGPVQKVTTVIEDKPPVLTFGLDRIPELRPELLGVPLWQYLATLIYLAIAYVCVKIFDFIVAVQLKKVASRTRTAVDDLVIELFRGPLKMLALVLFLHLGLNLFNWPAWMEVWLAKGFKLLIAFSFTYMSLKLVDLGARYWRSRPAVQADKTFNDLLVPLVTKTIKAFIIIMAVLATLDNLGFNIRTLLAGASISGLALGLAAQDTVGNLFGAAAVFVDKPFKLGDRIQAPGIDGIVEEIGLRSTRVRNLDGHLITVPNKTMGNATIINITRRPNIKTTLNIGITYDTPAGRVQEALGILSEVYRGNPMTHDVIIGFNNFADSSLNIQVIHWWKGLDFKEYMAGLQGMNLEIKRRFDDAGISFAFPSRTVYLRQDNEWRIQANSQNAPEKPA